MAAFRVLTAASRPMLFLQPRAVSKIIALKKHTTKAISLSGKGLTGWMILLQSDPRAPWCEHL